MASRIDLTADVVALTRQLVDVPSVSGSEQELADDVAEALHGYPQFSVLRDGDALVARTDLGLSERVLLAGHLDTVPIADNLPARLDGEVMHGCGTADMKSGVAVLLRMAELVSEPAYDLTLVCYDHEEVEAAKNGLGRLERRHPDWLAADLAILLEPTHGRLEAGCQGTLRAVLHLPGRRAHSARAWLGENAIHAAAPVLDALAAYRPREVDIDGCIYREGLNAVRIAGGVAGNVIPDACEVTVNFRFAPDRSVAQAQQFVRETFAAVVPSERIDFVDLAGGALPGLHHDAAAQFVAEVRDLTGQEPVAKYGWTDVARFAELGIPAVNYGPGDPALAHTREEHVETPKIREAERVLSDYLSR